MEHSPSWEANRPSASQEIPCILWNRKFHYRLYNCQPPVPMLSQINSVHASPSQFFKIHFNIILLPMPRSFKWSLYSRSPYQNPVCTSLVPHTCHMLYLILLNWLTRITFGDAHRSLSYSLCSLLHSPVTLSLLGPNIFLSTLFSKTLLVCSSLSVTDQV
jgi:hypothetical protein